MDMETTAKLAARSARTTLDTAAGLLNEKPAGLARLFFAFAPKEAVAWIENRRLRLRQIKLQEDLFDLCCRSLLAEHDRLMKKSVRSPGTSRSPSLLAALDRLEDDLRLLAVVKKSLEYLPEDDGVPEQIESQAEDEEDVSWWSTFESFARRPNETWRRDLLSKALAANAVAPGCIRLKALWEIGMLESDDFLMLSLFSDAAVHVDGKPLVLLDPEEQNTFLLDTGEGLRQANFAHVVADLVDRRLVQHAITLFGTTNEVELSHLSGPHRLKHVPLGLAPGGESAIQLSAFGPSDYALDLFRLYEPRFNAVADANFACLKTTLENAAVEDLSIGTIIFGDARL